jgi:1,4-dihydroxy-2-naphthoate octaprenyltransferase
VLIFLGTSVAAAEGSFQLWRAILALVGLTLLHVSVNVLNEYSDFRTGIDFQTAPTPFSGGSGMLTAGKIAPASAYAVGMACLGVGVIIGILFVWVTNLSLVPLLVVGGLAVAFYTNFLARHVLGEVFAGLGLGFLPILGACFVQTGSYSLAAVAAGIPAGILTLNLLLLNEFPDVEADREGGRKNLITAFGEVAAGRIYSCLLAMMYIWIAVASVFGFMPALCLVALGTLAVAWKPMKWAWKGGEDKEQTVPALGANVVTNLATQTLLGIGFIAAAYLRTA